MKRLYRSRTERKIAGVCGGLATYLGIDPVIPRILWVVLALGADKFLMQIPRIAPLSSTGVTVTVKRVGPGEYQLVYTGESQPADFVAGALEGGAEDSSIFGLRAQVVRREPAEFELRVTGPLR